MVNIRKLERPNLLIIPTHAHAHTLPFALQSAQNQSIQNLDIVVIGDGVTDETRDAVSPFLPDDRIHFLDMPKGIRHGEEYRDVVIRNSPAEVVSYLGDDDLLFPQHTELMRQQLSGVDFVNPLPIFINVDGSLDYVPTDLGTPASLLWHLDDAVHRNSVSLTGVMHTKESYLRLPFGWRPAPQGRWTDHFMWHQYFQLQGFQAKTLPISTTAKFGDGERKGMKVEKRVREIKKLLDESIHADFQEKWNERVFGVVRAKSVEQLLKLQNIDTENSHLREEIARLVELNLLSSQELSHISKELSRLIQSKSWKLTSPLRKFRSLFG